MRTGNAAVRLEADAVGRVDLAPNSVLRAAGGKRLALQRGELHAFIWAPAREFVVDTPSARAVDLGCEYTLNVDEKGDGMLRVSTRLGGLPVRRSRGFIPAGATCATRKRGGPGIPYFEDASDDAARRSSSASNAATRRRSTDFWQPPGPRDGLTLWHLLTRVPEAERGAVFDRFRNLVQSAAGVSATKSCTATRVPSISAGMRSAWRIPAGGAAGNGNGSN